MRHWFERGAIAPTQEGLREDWYLYSVENSSLGIKLREANLEIKQRLQNIGIHPLLQNIQGQVETWIKWEFSLDSNSFELPQFNQSDGFWVLVQKERASKYYSLATDAIEQVETPSEVEQGCALELTELQVWDQHWHSLGLETFGKVEHPEATPKRVMQKVFPDLKPSLKAADSFGYPYWLQEVQRLQEKAGF
jgi:hypothetical protein